MTLTTADNAIRSHIGWALIAAWAVSMLAAAIWPTWGLTAFVLQVLVLTAFAFVHGSARYGKVAMLVFFVVMWGVVNGLENLSIETGFPFGSFHHTSAAGPKLFHVPLITGFAYFSAGYLAWMLANLILREPDRESGVIACLGLPLVAMFIVTGWDACIDPIGGTVARNWVWTYGGGYFGVPLSNYLGWLLTTFVAFGLFSVYLARRPKLPYGHQSRSWWLQPAVQFGIMSLQYPLNLLTLPDVVVNDPVGGVWNTGDIYTGTTVVSIMTMMFVAVTCIFLALRSEHCSVAD